MIGKVFSDSTDGISVCFLCAFPVTVSPEKQAMRDILVHVVIEAEKSQDP